MYAETERGPIGAIIIVGAHGFGVVMCVARLDFVVNRPRGEDMTNARACLYRFVIKLRRVIVVVRCGTFAWR
jgi:hypothetical protein